VLIRTFREREREGTRAQADDGKCKNQKDISQTPDIIAPLYLGETYQECDQEAKWEQFMEEAGMQEGKGTEMLMAMELVGEENQVNHMENQSAC
jgi:hypothetical protein